MALSQTISPFTSYHWGIPWELLLNNVNHVITTPKLLRFSDPLKSPPKLQWLPEATDIWTIIFQISFGQLMSNKHFKYPSVNISETNCEIFPIFSYISLFKGIFVIFLFMIFKGTWAYTTLFNGSMKPWLVLITVYV